jgi:hypothetical protein
MNFRKLYCVFPQIQYTWYLGLCYLIEQKVCSLAKFPFLGTHPWPFLRARDSWETLSLLEIRVLLKLFSILVFAKNCWQLKSNHMSEYQLLRLFDDFGQVWIRISCNFSSSSGTVLPLSLSNGTLGKKKTKQGH